VIKGTKIKKEFRSVSIPGAGIYKVRINKRTKRAIGGRE